MNQARIAAIPFPRTNYYVVALLDFACPLRSAKLCALAHRTPNANLVLGNGIRLPYQQVNFLTVPSLFYIYGYSNKICSITYGILTHR